MANSRTGAEQLTVAKVLTDVVGGTTTYDTPYEFTKKLMIIGVKEDKASEKQYADDQTVDIYSEDGDITLDIDVTDLTEDEKAMLLGQTMAAGVRTPAPSDVRPYFCVMWKGKKRDKKYKYNKVLKVQFSEPDESYETQKGPSKPQTDKFVGIGIQRLSDGIRKRIADEASTTWVPGTGTSWFTSGDITPDVVAPTIASTLPAAAAANVVVAGFTFAWTFSEAILASTVVAGNFFIFADVAMTMVAGTLSQNAAGTVVTFTPDAPLTAAAVYKAVATSDVADLSGNKLAATDVRKFTMAA